MGTPESDVTQSGGGPCALVASQSGGNAGGTTPSKFSLNVCKSQHPGHGSGVGVGPAAARTSTRPQPTSSGEVDSPARWPIAREELITAAARARTAAVQIANVVARLIEAFISLCHCRVKNKSGRIRPRELALTKASEPIIRYFSRRWRLGRMLPGRALCQRAQGESKQVQPTAPKISTCPTCGGALEETSNGELGCMVCLLRAGIGGEAEVSRKASCTPLPAR
jgi:hypothetical protein